MIYRVAALPLVERVAKSMRFSGSAVWTPPDARELDELYRTNESQHRAIIGALRAGSPAAPARSRASMCSPRARCWSESSPSSSDPIL